MARRATRRKRAAPSNGLSTVRRKSPLAHDAMTFIRRFVVVSDAQLVVLALWAIHTHCVEVFRQTPFLAVTSPERECGKSRLLEVLELLVARPWMITQPSEAVIFRKINAEMPTLLLDEVDTIFSPKTAQYHEGLRGILDEGHRRHGKVPRYIGDQVVDFKVYCPKVLAGIGTLPDTITGRSIPIRLQRRTRDEPIERFITWSIGPGATALRDQIAAWAQANKTRLSRMHPRMPEELSDRMQEGCEPLVAIADRLGVGAEARAALVELLTGERVDTHDTMRVRLLRDIKSIFEQHDDISGKRVRGIRTTTLLQELHGIEEGGWDHYYGRRLEAKDLADLVRHYEVHPKPIKLKGETHKGYRRDDLHAVWTRYLGDDG